ncbi:MAG: hypothetical protein Q7S43_04660 [bacterium]|nr:hypothetical protein [bacterium]
MEKAEKLAVLEILCVFFWFLFDGFWLMEWMWLTYAGSLISFLLAVAIFFYLEREIVAMLIAIVDTFWLLMNIFWIVADFSKLDWALEAAKISFLIGTSVFVLAFIISASGKKFVQLLLRRLRVLKLLYSRN